MAAVAQRLAPRARPQRRRRCRRLAAASSRLSVSTALSTSAAASVPAVSPESLRRRNDGEVAVKQQQHTTVPPLLKTLAKTKKILSDSILRPAALHCQTNATRFLSPNRRTGIDSGTCTHVLSVPVVFAQVLLHRGAAPHMSVLALATVPQTSRLQ